MGAKEPGPRQLWVKEPGGLKTQVDIADGALVTCNLEVELVDMVFEAADPAGLLCMVVTSFLLVLVDEFCKFLNEVPNFCHASAGERRADHTDDGGGKGA